jgi:cardiolipin synthase
LKDWTPPRAAAGEVRVLVLSSRPGRGYVETAAVLAALVATARERVWITVGYFAPHRRALSSLCEGARRGLDVRLLLPGRTDVPLVRHAGHASFGLLLESGVRLFEYRSAVLHAKTMVVDQGVSVVGSSNLDFRSFRYNAECNLVLLDRGCAERLAAAFTEDLEASGELDLAAWRERNPLHRAADGAAGLLTPIL